MNIIDAVVFAPGCILVTVHKPGGGLTSRYLDELVLLALLLHALAGGRLACEAKGKRNSKFYLRMHVHGGKERRPYALRTIVGTLPGNLTIEAKDFHDLRRCVLGRFVKPKKTTKWNRTLYGRPELIGWSGEHFNEAIAAGRIFGIDTNAFPHLLEEVWSWIDADLPLLQADPHPLTA